MDSLTLKCLSLNANGLLNSTYPNKLDQLIHDIKEKKADITFLLETHIYDKKVKIGLRENGVGNLYVNMVQTDLEA